MKGAGASVLPMPSRIRLALIAALLLAPRVAWATPLESAAHAFAREQFAEVLRHLPTPQTQAEANLLRGRALLRLGRPGEAEAALQGLAAALPELRDLALFTHAEALDGMGKHAEAAAEYRAAARSLGSRFIYLSFRRRAEALLAAKEWSAAAQEFSHLMRTQPAAGQRPDWELALALCHDKLGKHREAAARLREIWLTWPASTAAPRARKEMERILAKRKLKLPPLKLGRRLARVRLLRKEKLYAEAVAELKAMRKELKGEEAVSVDVETALMYIWANKPADALAVLEKLPAKNGVMSGWHRRALTAACMARTGKVEDGAQLLLKQSWKEKGPLRPDQRSEIARAALLYAEYGRYAEALKLRLRLLEPNGKLGEGRRGAPKGKQKLSPETHLQLGWLSFRAGKHAEALKHLDAWHAKAKGEQDFGLYWLARTQAKAGQADKAEALYRELLEKHPHSYYGLLARTRLAEMSKLKLTPGKCSLPPASAPAARHADALARMEALEKRYGGALPELHRAHVLWRLGMIADARRELRLLAIRVAWVAAKGRPREWIQRPLVERLWRGGPLETRRWGKAEKELATAGVALRHSVGGLLAAAGISYFGWQLGTPATDPERRRNPRAYPDLVQAMAGRFKLDPNLIWAIMRTESTYRLDVISRVGATGLMQIMPHTARRIAAAMKLRDFEHDQLFEPDVNLQMAAWYLQALSTKFRGQIPLIAAGYNGGPHHVARWLEMRGARCEMDEFIEEIPFSESRRYAKKILRLVRLYERVHCAKDDLLATNKLDPRFTPDPDF
jgi:soluble lytic murein transglycosylase